MKNYDIEKVNHILRQCTESQESWIRKSTLIRDILNQLQDLQRTKWEIFEMPEFIKEKVEESLEMRLLDELELLSDQIKSLERLDNELDSYKSSLQTYCSALVREVTNPAAFECLRILCKICSCIRLLIGTMKMPLRRISLEDLESFQLLEDANSAMKEVKNGFEKNVTSWTEKVTVLEF